MLITEKNHRRWLVLGVVLSIIVIVVKLWLVIALIRFLWKAV